MPGLDIPSTDMCCLLLLLQNSEIYVIHANSPWEFPLVLSLSLFLCSFQYMIPNPRFTKKGFLGQNCVVASLRGLYSICNLVLMEKKKKEVSHR